jgi:hypothetical protein
MARSASRSSLPLLVPAGIVAAMLVAISCVGVSALVWEHRPHQAGNAAAVAPHAAPSRPPSPSAPPLTGAACVPGIWREVSEQVNTTVGGEHIRITGSGATQTFTLEGSEKTIFTAATADTGTLNGSTYTVTFSGYSTTHYQVIGNKIFYSEAAAVGTTIWRRNGGQIDKQKLEAGLGPDTFTCAGDKFFQYGDDYSIELVRQPPG